MKNGDTDPNGGKLLKKDNINSLGFFISILTTILTVVTFGIAVFTPPISGPFCLEGSINYPFLDIISRFPRDYFWMYPAILLTIFFVIFIVCIHQYAADDKKIYSQIGLSFALIAATILITDYFVQISVIQPSLLNGETDGISILTQYNPHGLFIALEEIGYLMMSLAFFCVSPVFSKATRLEKSLRWVFISCFILTCLSLIMIAGQYGINREYRFEVAVITIDWMVLILSGILMSMVYRRSMQE
ncbi:hypothetical protein ASZ90_018596 [hydrocarbon metagenome]|uniref:DUF998 domain-containing protein n=1 Tax=hydrocarbon metagenome TaxID=938273 RepID=A0A0W8E5R1_9ZZZZ